MCLRSLTSSAQAEPFRLPPKKPYRLRSRKSEAMPLPSQLRCRVFRFQSHSILISRPLSFGRRRSAIFCFRDRASIGSKHAVGFFRRECSTAVFRPLPKRMDRIGQKVCIISEIQKNVTAVLRAKALPTRRRDLSI